MNPAVLAEWPLISRLLDEAIELPVAERTAWLDRLSPEHAHLKSHLAGLLAASGGVDGIEATLPNWPQYTSNAVGTGATVNDGFNAGDIFGQYRLLRPLGAGGMGSVWLAESTTSAVKLPVALKLPRLGTKVTSGYLKERFERERVILGALNHPNIARLYEAGVTAEGQPFLALEYINGETLIAHCNQKRLPIKERLALFVQVLKALQYAHSNLIIHRDLKPSNILVTQTGEVKLLDFGIAKLLDTDSLHAHETELTQLGGRAMTPDYASPEQIRGDALTTTSDVYSAGVLLYELLTGKRPYKLKRGSHAELEEAILTSDVSRPSTVISSESITTSSRHELRGDLDTIILKALKKNPTDRYASATALQDDVGRFIRSEPVLAQADSFAYRFRKFVLRNRLLVSAGTAVFAALVVGLAVALSQANQARIKSQLAEQEAARANTIRAFLTSLFERNTRQQASAASARNKTVRDVLLDASEKIEGAFVNEPVTRAELTKTIGTLLLDVDEYERAEKLLSESVALGSKHGFTKSDSHIEALSTLATANRLLGKGSDVLKARDAALSLLDERNDKSSLLRARVLANTPGQFAKDIKREEALINEAITLFEKDHKNHPAYFGALFTAAQLQRTQGYWASALKRFEKATTVFESTGSRDFTNLASAFVWRGFCESQLGRPRDGIVNIERGMALANEQLGANSPQTRFYRSLYALTLHRAGARKAAHAEFSAIRESSSEQKSVADFDAAVYEAKAHVIEGSPAAAVQILMPFSPQLVDFGRRFYPNGVEWATTLAKAQAMQGNHAAADAALARISEIPTSYSLGAVSLDVYKFDVSWMALIRGEHEKAHQILAVKKVTAPDEAHEYSDVILHFDLRSAEIELALARQGATDASVLRKSALKRAQRTMAFLNKFSPQNGMPYKYAYAHYVLGIALKANDNRAEGDAALMQALSLMRELHHPKSIWLRNAELALSGQ